MSNSISFGQYLPGKSLFHRLDPRAKIISSFFLVISIMLLNNLKSLFITGFVLCLAVAFSGIPLRKFLQSFKLILFLILFTMIAHFFFTPGETLYKWGIVKVTREGLYQGITMSLKFLYVVTVTSLVTITTSPMAMTDGLLEIFKPFRRIGLPAEELAMMMAIALRFLPTLWEETEKIKKAQMSRGAQFDSGNIRTRIRHITSLMVPILVSAFRRADELALAMESRAFQVGMPRSRLRVLRFTFLDYITLCVVLIILVVSVYMAL